MANGVHEVEDARGPLGIPPGCGEGGEVREFIGGDGGVVSFCGDGCEGAEGAEEGGGG